MQHGVLFGSGRVVGQLHRLRPRITVEAGEPDADVRYAFLRAGEPDAAERTIRQHSKIRGVVLHLRRGQQRLAPAGFIGGAQHAVGSEDVLCSVLLQTTPP